MGAAIGFLAEAEARKFVTRVTPLEGHRLWAASYDSELNPLVALDERTMFNILGGLDAKRMIDVGCGTGRYLLHLQQSGAEVFGVDVCESMLAQAAKHSPLRGRLTQADVARLPFCDGAADLVLCSLSLGYFPNLRSVLDELARIATPNGRIAITDLHPEAIAAGWNRCFKINGTRYEIEHCIYELDEIEEAAAAAGLRLVSRHAAYLGDPEWFVFKNAGKQHLFAPFSAVPVLFAGLWEKSC